MEYNKETMSFFSFPREIRDLVYTHLAPNETACSITSTKGGINIETFCKSEPNLSVMKLCKTIQFEVLETLCRNNTFRFSFSGFDTGAKSFFCRFAPLMTHIDFDVSPFRRANHHQDWTIQHMEDQVREAVRVLNSSAIVCKSCRLTINNMNPAMPPLLHSQIPETIKTLVEVDTLMIVMERWPPDMWELRVLLEPSLGPSTITYEWYSTPGVPWVDLGYVSVKFQPKRFLAERKKYQKQL